MLHDLMPPTMLVVSIACATVLIRRAEYVMAGLLILNALFALSMIVGWP